MDNRIIIETVLFQKKKIMIKKIKSVSQLKKDLDAIFSKYIRQRYANDLDYVSCFTCGKTKLWKHLQCGHYVSRSFTSLRWNEKNCQVQCGQCNIYKKGNLDIFARNLERKYGPDILIQLEIKKRNKMKLMAFEYEVLIRYYKDLINNLYK